MKYTSTKVIWQKVESVVCIHSPGGSIKLTVWLQFAIAWFGGEFDPQNLPFSWGPETPSSTMCHWTSQVHLPNGIYIHCTI